MTFNEFGLDDRLLEAISYMGFEKATPVQEGGIPVVLQGRDLIACAQTGTGKTAAYLLPVMHRMLQEPGQGINTLVLVPTRELALQIDQQAHGFAYFAGISCLSIYGGGDGANWEQEKKALMEGSGILIATPGKLISHLNLGYVNFSNIRHLVLDEADRMLDIGFFEDMLKIISYVPAKRQTLMFSATMPPKIRELTSKILTNPAEISVEMSKPPEGVLQVAYLAHEPQKAPFITGLIADKPQVKSILIFSSTKKKVGDIVRALKGKGYKVEGISSDFEQKEREAVLIRFKSRETRVLVATDVLSRGIDIKDIDIVINFDVPQDAEDYVHRVGRTARAEATGIALTLITPADMMKFQRIEKLIGKEVLKMPVPPEFGESPKWDPKPDREGFHRGGGRGFAHKGRRPQRSR